MDYTANPRVAQPRKPRAPYPDDTDDNPSDTTLPIGNKTPIQSLVTTSTASHPSIDIVSPTTDVPDAGLPYDEFDESPQNLARLPRHEQEGRAKSEKARQERQHLEVLRRPWDEHAAELTGWTWERLVNRDDIWGQYLPFSRRTEGHKVVTMPWKSERGKVTLTEDVIHAHFKGNDVGMLIGLHTISPDNMCKWMAFDIDRHDDDPKAPSAEANEQDGIALHEILRKMGLHPVLTDSNGEGGFHLHILLDCPLAASHAYKFAQAMVAKIPGRKMETFPKQRGLKEGELGNWLRLFGRHHTRKHFTRVYADGVWLEGHEAIARIVANKGDDPHIILQELNNLSSAPPQTAAGTSPPSTTQHSKLAAWFRDVLERLPVGHLDEYDDWLRVGLAIRHELPGDEGLAVWDEASQRSEKYQAGACAEKWAGFTSTSDHPVTAGTLIAWIREVDPGYRPPNKSGTNANDPANATPIEILTWAQRRQRSPNPQYKAEVIKGLVRRSEVMNLVSGVKIGKSWLGMQLALDVASGKKWLGHDVQQGKVLLVDGELSGETLDTRLAKVAEVLGIDIATVENNISVAVLRHEDANIDSVEKRILAQITTGTYALIIFDPMYRMLPDDASEANDQDLRRMYAHLIRIAGKTDAALVIIVHTTKGSQVGKKTTEVGSGHGVLSRVPDTHVTLLAVDETQEPVTEAIMKAVTRTFPPAEPKHLQKIAKDVPVWRLADPNNKEDPDSCPEGRDLLEAMKFASICARPEPEHKDLIVGRHDHIKDKSGTPISKTRAKYLFQQALSAGHIVQIAGPDKRSPRYKREPTAAEDHSKALTQALQEGVTGEQGTPT